MDIVRVSPEDRLLLSRLRIPHACRAIFAPREDALAVGAPRHAYDGLRMSLEESLLLARLRVPHACRAVPTPREDALAVGAPRHARDRCRVADEGLHRERVPQPQVANVARLPGVVILTPHVHEQRPHPVVIALFVCPQREIDLDSVLGIIGLAGLPLRVCLRLLRGLFACLGQSQIRFRHFGLVIRTRLLDLGTGFLAQGHRLGGGLGLEAVFGILLDASHSFSAFRTPSRPSAPPAPLALS